jgi:hypothetical protein
MGRHPYREPLIWITICVWTGVGILGVTRFKFAARLAPITIQLESQPKTIRLSVDNERYGGGAYIDTPIKLQLKAGRHRMKIARDGFVSHIVSIEGQSGDFFRMDNVVLARSPSTPMANVQVVADDDQAHFDIDDGLVRGVTPSDATEKTADQVHQLTLYPQWPNKDQRQRCRFTPVVDPSADGAPFRLRVRLKNGKFKVTGCDPSKASQHH